MAGLINANESVKHPGSLFLGGEWVEPSTPARFDVVNPATEDVFLTVAEAGAQDVSRAVDAGRGAFDRGPWSRMTHAERAPYVRAIGAAIRERSAELGRIWTSEMGILAAASTDASAQSGDVFDFYAGLAHSYEWVEQHQPSSSRGVGLLVREPVGMVAPIIPRNSPQGLIANKVAPALIAGCTVVVKASPKAPGAAYVFAEIVEACGLPAGVVNVVTAEREVWAAHRLAVRGADRPLHARARWRVRRRRPRRVRRGPGRRDVRDPGRRPVRPGDRDGPARDGAAARQGRGSRS